MGQKNVKRPKENKRTVDPRKKKNPASILTTLHEINEAYFGGNFQRASEELTKILNKDGFPKYLQRSISARQISDILNDETYVRYWHLELFAHHVRVPTAFLLIYSRLKSNSLNVTKSPDTIKVIEALRHIGASVDQNTLITIELLKKWAEVFSPNLDPLPLFESLDRA